MDIFQASYTATWLKHAETASVKPKRDSDFGLFRVVSFHRFIVSGYGWLSGRGLPETFTLQGVPQQNDHEMAINEMFGKGILPK